MSEIPDWALKYKTKGVQIRRFGNNLYAYHHRSVCDMANRRPKSLPPEYLGVVPRSGIVKKCDITGIKSDYEYGNIALLHGIAEKTILPPEKGISIHVRENNQLCDPQEHTAASHEICALPV